MVVHGGLTYNHLGRHDSSRSERRHGTEERADQTVPDRCVPSRYRSSHAAVFPHVHFDTPCVHPFIHLVSFSTNEKKKKNPPARSIFAARRDA